MIRRIRTDKVVDCPKEKRIVPITAIAAGADPNQFTCRKCEYHGKESCLVEGFCEVMCPWPARYEPNQELLDDLRGDHHYYMLGRALGILAWITTGCVIAAIFR